RRCRRLSAPYSASTNAVRSRMALITSSLVPSSEGGGQHRRERGEELAVRQMLREHLAYGLSQCVGPLAGLVFLVLVGAADDLHGPASSGSSMSSSSTSFLICWRSRSPCVINSS